MRGASDPEFIDGKIRRADLVHAPRANWLGYMLELCGVGEFCCANRLQTEAFDLPDRKGATNAEAARDR